jgi:ornithine carbamoyltransferase
MKHFINILDHDTEALETVLRRAAELKARYRAGIPEHLLAGATVALLFEKPSMRTRVSLERAAHSLGGQAIYLESSHVRLGTRESLEDGARVLSRYVQCIAARTFAHETIETLAEYASVPVINGLSDWSHPTQALADFLTMQERLGDLAGRTLAYIGDGNNVARSLAALAGRLGVRLVVAAPEGYALEERFLGLLSEACPGAEVRQTRDPAGAVADADAVYTDVWASMGQEEEAEARRAVFRPFQINAGLLAKAAKNPVVLHCLPAHRGEEITDEVMDGPRSAVFDQAENRMHVNRALFARLVAEAGS